MRILYLLIILLSLAMSAQAAYSVEEQDLFLDNTGRMALKFKLLDKLTLQKVNDQGEEVIASVKDGIDLKDFLANNS